MARHGLRSGSRPSSSAAGRPASTVGYELAKRGRPFVILDAHERVGDAWRRRWDSLLLFTPARIDGLPGMRFPARGGHVHHQGPDGRLPRGLRGPLRSAGPHGRAGRPAVGARAIASWCRRGTGRSRPTTSSSRWRTSSSPRRRRSRRTSIRASCSSTRTTTRTRSSSRTDPCWSSASATPAPTSASRSPAPTRRGSRQGVRSRARSASRPSWPTTSLLRIVRFVGHHVLTVRTPIGRKAPPHVPHRARAAHPREAEGPRRRPASNACLAIVGVQDGLPVTEDGRVLDVANVIWCTGFRPGFSWIDLPVLGEHETAARARHRRLGAGPVLRRPRVPLRGDVGDDHRRESRRPARRAAPRRPPYGEHRFPAGCRARRRLRVLGGRRRVIRTRIITGR